MQIKAARQVEYDPQTTQVGSVMPPLDRMGRVRLQGAVNKGWTDDQGEASGWQRYNRIIRLDPTLAEHPSVQLPGGYYLVEAS